METVFKKNEDIFLPKDAVSPLGSLMPAVYQEVGRQGPGTRPLGWGCSRAHLPAARRLRGHRHCQATGGCPVPQPGVRGQLAPSKLPPLCQGPHWALHGVASVTLPSPQHPHEALTCPPFQMRKQSLVRMVTAHSHTASVLELDSHGAQMSKVTV